MFVAVLGASYSAQAEFSSENKAAAKLSVQLSNMENYVRELQGQLEVIQHDIQGLRMQQERQNADYDSRFKMIEDNINILNKNVKSQKQNSSKASSSHSSKKQSSAAQRDESAENIPSEASSHQEKDEPSGKKSSQKLSPSVASEGEKNTDTKEKEVLDGFDSSQSVPKSPQKMFKYAKTLFDQGNYTEAENLFKTFIQGHPKDKNIHQAKFYLGSIHYVGGDFTQASLDLVQAYKANPQGDKAQESLVKLALCLQKLSKKSEACKTLNKLRNSFSNMTPSVKKQADQLNQKLDCAISVVE